MWLYFRDDDLGWEPRAFSRLLTTFARHDQKLNAAAIPCDLTKEVIEKSIPYSYQASPYLQVVTHGYRHKNYEKEGKNTEFGPSRSQEEVLNELRDGLKTIQDHFENSFACFVPPWNRIDNKHLASLELAGYQMLSRNVSESDKSGKMVLPEFNISLDLHTNKKEGRKTAKEIFHSLAKAYESGAESTGVMLHHTKMIDEDYETLDLLLKELSKRCIQSVFFSEMLPGGSLQKLEIEANHV
ncbi:MAG: hypothetical protein M9962_03990 [Oligoflexia bacterium]|nr:hypothetical protein [Oligoflexia bacterium]